MTLVNLKKSVFGKAVNIVHQVYADRAGITLTDDTVLDISVSYDGSWLTRSHSSHIGVGCVIDIWTGLCIDTHVMSKYCQMCESTVNTAAAEFNFGSYAARNTMQLFGFNVGLNTTRLGAAKMNRRLRNSLKYIKDQDNKRRDKVRTARLKRQTELIELEGGPAYAAGQF